MSQFKAACAYAVSQGWLIVEDDVLTLTAAGLGVRPEGKLRLWPLLHCHF